jgi:hypothetical protein
LEALIKFCVKLCDAVCELQSTERLNSWLQAAAGELAVLHADGVAQVHKVDTTAHLHGNLQRVQSERDERAMVRVSLLEVLG